LTRCGYSWSIREKNPVRVGPGSEQPGGVVEIPPCFGDGGGRVVTGVVLVAGDDVGGAEGFDYVQCPVPVVKVAVWRFGEVLGRDDCAQRE
jgi:hypothetical protein